MSAFAPPWPTSLPVASRKLSFNAVCAVHRSDGQGLNTATTNVRAPAAKLGQGNPFGCILFEWMEMRIWGNCSKVDHLSLLSVPANENILSNI